jgi:hypothetical protein
MTAYSDFDRQQAVEIANLCLGANRPELIPRFLIDGCHPDEVQRLLTEPTTSRAAPCEWPSTRSHTLHEEHATVLRPAYVGDIDWSDRTIEVVETAEQVVVNKTARVVEEISLKKVGTEHIETVHEKLRSQQAEIERVDASGKPIATPRP